MIRLLPILIFIQLILVGETRSQVFFTQTFDNVGGSTAGGPGTYLFPPDFFLRNVDNRLPDQGVGVIDDAWERLDDIPDDSVALSTSWYDPIGAANDFMWTPAIPLSGNNITLTWNAIVYDPVFRDGYEVRIMTVPPTGGTGVIGNQLTNSTLLLTVPEEDSNWIARSLDLNAYTGQTVYIGFRNNSVDKYVLAIDDIVVQNNTVVPLNSLSLSGIYQNGKNLLQWKVIGTDNRYNLSLQNSSNGAGWQDIYQDVYSGGKTDFSFAHAISAPKSFYRVKAVSPAGKTYVSNTILVSQRGSASILLYPTPANDKLNIQGSLKNARVVITDVSGKKMLNELVQDDSRAFDVSKWPTGIYFATILTADHTRYLRKVMVKH
jgi:hypothetical protein